MERGRRGRLMHGKGWRGKGDDEKGLHGESERRRGG